MADEQPEKSNALIAAAKVLGAAAAKIATLTRGETPKEALKPAPESVRLAKFQPSGKARLPRKLKKAQKKAASRKV